jgi:putative peptidoglycan lipid II flippase
MSVRDELDLLLLLGIGTTAGIVVMACSLVPALWRSGLRVRPVFEWRDPAVRTIVRLSGWTVGYVVANQVAQLFVLLLAKSGGAGDVSAYSYAFIFNQVPHGLLAVSIMTTITPELARRVTANDTAGLRREFEMGMRYIIVLMIPATVFFAVAAQPVLGMIVRNEFTAQDAAITADTLQLFALSLVPMSLYLYTMRGFYALKDTKTPFLINLFENGLNVGFAIALFPALGVQGLALAWGIAYLVSAGVAVVALRRRIGKIPSDAVVRSAGRALVAGAALAAVAAPLAGAIGHGSAGAAALATLFAGLAGGAVYVLVLAALRADELGALLAIARRRRPPVANVPR